MDMRRVLLVLGCAVAAAAGFHLKEVCYDGMGCFSLQKPWRSLRRLVPAPLSPEDIDTKLWLCARPDIERRHLVTVWPHISLNAAPFDPSLLTVLIIHGFATNGSVPWMNDLKNAYLNQAPANVLLVDWGGGATMRNYMQVAANTRVVGRHLAALLDYLAEQTGARKFHLIGHSMGAQIASYAAKETKVEVQRLTALDPAQPAFEGFDPAVHLDPGDANLVDVLHSDARPFFKGLGVGMIMPHGHVDFYMNGGSRQPGCPTPFNPDGVDEAALGEAPVDDLAAHKGAACSHLRAIFYFIEALEGALRCTMFGHRASQPQPRPGQPAELVEASLQCNPLNCVPLGFFTPYSRLRGSFVVRTKAHPPFCIPQP